MSDGISNWYDSMDRYEALCKRYDEPVQYYKTMTHWREELGLFVENKSVFDPDRKNDEELF